MWHWQFLLQIITLLIELQDSGACKSSCSFLFRLFNSATITKGLYSFASEIIMLSKQRTVMNKSTFFHCDEYAELKCSMFRLLLTVLYSLKIVVGSPIPFHCFDKTLLHCMCFNQVSVVVSRSTPAMPSLEGSSHGNQNFTRCRYSSASDCYSSHVPSEWAIICSAKHRRCFLSRCSKAVYNLIDIFILFYGWFRLIVGCSRDDS